MQLNQYRGDMIKFKYVTDVATKRVWKVNNSNNNNSLF